MFLGIDIGTSEVKATVVDDEGNILAHARRRLTIHGIKEKKRELNPIEVKDKVLGAAAEVIKRCKTAEISLITLSSLGEAVVPVDRSGQVLMNSIVGSDPRGAEELQNMNHHYSAAELAGITGLNPSSIYSLNKILYIRKHFPDIDKQVWKYMCFTDYIGFLLTAEAAIDYSMASRTMLFDIRSKQWSDAILSRTGISPEVLSSPVPGGSIIGTLRGSIKRTLGLSGEVPVMAGSHDHIFNALGAGAFLPGVCSNVLGTTEGITAVLNSRMPTSEVLYNNISCQPFVQPDMYNTVAWHNTAGAMVNWFVDIFYRNCDQPKDVILNQLGSQLSDEPSTLMILPHFAGATAKYMDERAKGAILGLTLTTDREEIYKAILEGAAYECRMILDCIANAHISADKIIVSGGGSSSSVWLKIKANILGRTIYRSACADTGAIGGALLGAVTLGRYQNLSEAAKNMTRPGDPIDPEGKYHESYEERYQEYRELYSKLKRLNHQLS